MNTSSLTTSWTAIPTGDGTMDAYVARPAASRAPGIVLLQEIFGVNAAMRAKADDLAAAGYAVAVPDLFWRLQPRVDLGYSEPERQQGFGLMQKFDAARGVADTVATASWLAAQPFGNGKVAFVGFCLGGKIALLAGARYADTAAVISFYGVRLDQNLAELAALRAPFQFHVGDRDSHIPSATVEVLRRATAGRADREIHVYPGAQHGFFNRLRGEVYDATAAEQANGRMLAVLQRMVG